MSVDYVPVAWNRSKKIYDAIAIAGIVAYLLIYLMLGPLLQRITLPLDAPTMAMKAYGSCAFILLTVILCIGPAARLNPRFLPLLYNRRHLGVMTCVVAASHVQAVLGWYFAFSPTPTLVGLLGADTDFSYLRGFPFPLFGVFGFVVLLLLASTSHDFWLAFLTPRVWKTLHMLIYPAYAALVLHQALGVVHRFYWFAACTCWPDGRRGDRILRLPYRSMAG
jgi:DMSO/TMAO reductase YedYZ heme-binding membrane subunit